MQLILELPKRSEALASNRQRWAEILDDPQWADHLYRIETNAFGQIVATPPAGGSHSVRQSEISFVLRSRLGGRALAECPISTVGGVRAADVGWYSDQRFSQVRGQLAFEIAPEICVEVLSPRNTDAEMDSKRQLYFDAGANECWICDLQGTMSYYHCDDPTTRKDKSNLCADFPAVIDD